MYADGKVCLSLLGTWEGPRWVPGVSTLSQVLLSIQSAILVDAPWANEPGDEAHLRTDRGARAVAKHNMHLRLATLRHAILEPLKRPPVCAWEGAREGGGGSPALRCLPRALTPTTPTHPPARSL